MGNIFGALAQLLDFVWKAMQAYAQTPQGEKELADILNAWENVTENQAQGTSAQSPSTGIVRRIPPQR